MALLKGSNDEPLIVAAGILFLAATGRVLLVRRTEEPYYWSIPGGKLEDGESAYIAAVRECQEELQFDARSIADPSSCNLLTRRIKDGVDYTTFINYQVDEFFPILNEEHSAHLWIEPKEALQLNLHPGVVIALKRGDMNERDVAIAMSEGELVSPQNYHNMTLWKMRFTGTGFSLRPDKHEFVLRPREIWHNEEQINRITGVPVIWEHPPGATLNSEEHAARVIGSVVYAYSSGEDIDCIARVYDDEANKMMAQNKLSTSPTVVFGPNSGNKEVDTGNGSHLVIEGDPSYIDHLAVCEVGVWDKGNAPSGVKADSIILDGKGYKMVDMVEDKRSDAEKEADAKMDARMDAFKKDCADMIADAFRAMKDSMKSDSADKMKADSEEKEKADAEEKKKTEEKEKADAEEKMKADAKEPAFLNDAKKADAIIAENAEMKRRLREFETKFSTLESKLPKQLSDDDFNAMGETQAKADSIYQNFGKRAPRPLDGETHVNYRKRLASGLKVYSSDWKEMDLTPIEGKMLDTLEAKIYADALEYSMNPSDFSEGEIREVRRLDPASQRTITEFRGKKTFIHEMGRAKRIVGRLGLPRN